MCKPNVFSLLTAPPIKQSFNRRKSVFAEHYDPEDDDEEPEKVVNPKSDQQRKRLAEAIKNILLFRSLDGVSSKSSLLSNFIS